MEAARKIEAKLALGDMGIMEDHPNAPMFKENADIWLNGYVKRLRRQSTFADGPLFPAYVQKQLGHHSISMTVDIYGHWIPGEGKKDLTKTLRGAEAKSRRLLSVVEDRE